MRSTATASARSSAGEQAFSTGCPGRSTCRATREYTLTALGDVEVAVCGALADERLEPRLVTPKDVEIEVRGSGNATRQINHILKPEFPGAAAPRRRSVHPRRELVELPAAQARRGRSTGRGRARGGLLLPHAERAAGGVRRAAPLQPTVRHRHDRDGARRRHHARAARLPHDRGGARLRPVLPQRACRRPAFDGLRG